MLNKKNCCLKKLISIFTKVVASADTETEDRHVYVPFRNKYGI